MLASTILGEDVLSYDQQVEVVRTDAGSLAGQTLAGADVRGRTGCTIIAVQRDEELLADLDPEFRIQEGDTLVVAGPDEDVNRFAALVD
jgi:K+/H+ antiporter YhaU regulatory subunit KhtT